MNEELIITSHAKTRMKQRGISMLVVEWLCRFGTEKITKGGALLYFDKAAMKQLKKYLGRTFPKFETQIRDNYMIICGSAVVTVGHRYKSIR